MKRRTVVIIAMIWMVVITAVVSVGSTLALMENDGTYLVSQDDYDALQRYRRLEEVHDALVQDYYV